MKQQAKKKATKPKLKVVPFVDRYIQRDILEQCAEIKKLTKEGKITNAIFYIEDRSGNYHVHETANNSCLRTGTILMKLALIRLGH